MAKKLVARDPFEVIGNIPKGKTYQWVALAVYGDTSVVESQTDAVEAGGWKPVPARRHPKMKKGRRNRIVVGDQVLVERDAALTDAALRQNHEAARAQFDNHEASIKGRSRLGSTSFNALSPAEPVDYSANLARVTAELKEADGAIDASIRVIPTKGEVEAAALLNLTLKEYMRRKVLMLEQIDPGLVLRCVSVGTFDFVRLSIQRIPT